MSPALYSEEFEWIDYLCFYRGIKVGEVHRIRGVGGRWKFSVHFRTDANPTGLQYPVVLKSRNSYSRITAAAYVEDLVRASRIYEVELSMGRLLGI